MKKTILKTNHRISNQFSKTFFILLMLGIYSTGHAMLGLGGSGGPFPIGDVVDERIGDWVQAAPLPELTPPCTVSNNCNEEDKYMPVWRWNATTRTMDACPSPLFVRKDEYTCNHIVRLRGGTASATAGSGTIDFNAWDPNCVACNIGYVGINAIIPEEQLHVRGNVRCDDGMFMGDLKVKNIFGAQAPGIGGIAVQGAQDVIEVHAPINFNAGLTSTSGTFTDMTVSNLTASNLSVSSMNLNSLTIGNLKPSGSYSSSYKLAVDGTIMAKEMITQSRWWADKVFHKGYKLYSLKELEEFITTHKHLPEIPSEKEILENGIAIDDMLRLQMQKIEELTLYVIQQQKEIEQLKKKIK